MFTITVHEVAHQWWSGLVGNDQAMEPWLDEALATYSEALYYEHVHPELLDWWWDFRVERYAPRGRVGSTIYEFVSFRPYVNAVYLRGAQFLASVRSEMGDETFFEMMRGYVATFRGQIATTTGFWERVAASGVGADALNHWYFQEEGPSLPDVPERTLDYSGSLEITREWME